MALNGNFSGECIDVDTGIDGVDGMPSVFNNRQPMTCWAFASEICLYLNWEMDR